MPRDDNNPNKPKEWIDEEWRANRDGWAAQMLPRHVVYTEVADLIGQVRQQVAKLDPTKVLAIKTIQLIEDYIRAECVWPPIDSELDAQ